MNSEFLAKNNILVFISYAISAPFYLFIKHEWETQDSWVKSSKSVVDAIISICRSFCFLLCSSLDESFLIRLNMISCIASSKTESNLLMSKIWCVFRIIIEDNNFIGFELQSCFVFYLFLLIRKVKRQQNGFEWFCNWIYQRINWIHYRTMRGYHLLSIKKFSWRKPAASGDIQSSIMEQKGQDDRKITLREKIWEEVRCFHDFLAKVCHKSNIHGLKFIFNLKLHPIERLLWLIAVGVTGFYSYNISMSQYARYVANPTVISLERDYRDWNGTLPAISVCYHRRVDEKRAISLIKRLWNIDRNDDEFSYFMDYVKAVVYINESNSKFNRFVNDKRLEYINMLTIAKEVHPVINSAISSFDTNAEFLMTEVITEKGICYSVNSIISHLISTT